MATRTILATPEEHSAEVPAEVVYAGDGGPYVDGCPGCVSGYLRPMRTVDDGNGGVVCTYAHEACGHRWFTSWAKEEPHVGIHGEAEPSQIGDTLRRIVAEARERGQH